MSQPEETKRTKSFWTVPNLLCMVRVLGSPVLIVLARYDQPVLFVGLFIVLMLTDWIDGKLAIRLQQESVRGAKIDTWADAIMYGCLLIGVVDLSWQVLAEDILFLSAVLAAYGVAVGLSLWKFRAWPAYHTRTAKVAWFLVLVGASLLVAANWVWPYRIALIGVFVAIVESITLTLMLDDRRVDVSSIFSVIRSHEKTNHRDHP